MYISIFWVIVVIVSMWLLLNVKQKREDQFASFRIIVSPKWTDLFKDFQLSTDNSWDKRVPQGSEYHLLRDGITFTVLKRDLIYSDDHHSFHSEIRFVEEIKEITLPSAMPASMGHPFVYVKEDLSEESKVHRMGYEIGIATPESIQKAPYPEDLRGRIKVAFLPYNGLGLYKYENLPREKLIENLMKYHWEGWSEEQAPLPGEHKPTFFCHKYFDVYLKYI
jgi:hypothetical protein